MAQPEPTTPPAPRKRPKPPGRKKGSLNKRTQFKSIREDLENAWDELGGPALAKRLLKQGIRDAEGFEAVEKEYAFAHEGEGENRKTVRVLLKEKVKHVKDTALLALLAPYFIQRVPQQQEITGAGGAPLVPPAPPLPPIDLSKLSAEKLDAFITATAAAAVAVRAPKSPAPAGEAAPAAGVGGTQPPAPAEESVKDIPNEAPPGGPTQTA